MVKKGKYSKQKKIIQQYSHLKLLQASIWLLLWIKMLKMFRFLNKALSCDSAWLLHDSWWTTSSCFCCSSVPHSGTQLLPIWSFFFFGCLKKKQIKWISNHPQLIHKKNLNLCFLKDQHVIRGSRKRNSFL